MEKTYNIVVQRPAEVIFRLLADLPGYRQWLGGSNLFNELIEISDNPVRQGTTYIDKGTSTTAYGEIVEYVPFRHLAFHQHTKMIGGLGSLEVRVRYTLNPVTEGTQVVREYEITLRGLTRLLQPLLNSPIHQENERILRQLKQALEAQ